MNKRIGSVFIALVIFLTTVALRAHHGYAVVFDPDKKVTLTGTLTKLDWRNPHIEISLDAKGDRGQVESWVIEGGPPNFFRNRNVDRSNFEKGLGQSVTVEAVRARDGSRFASLLKLTFLDGTFVTSAPGA